MTQPQIFVTLPAYNEGEAIVPLLRDLQQVLDSYSYQIFVVDDGSTDDSMTHVKAANLERVSIVAHPHNKGLGEALKTGFRHVLSLPHQESDILFVMDSDSTHPSDLMLLMIQHIQQGSDVVIASRYQPGAQVVGLSQLRLLMSNGASWVCRILCPIPNVKDYTCGYRAYRLGILQKAFDKYSDDFIRQTGFSCMAEAIKKLHRIGAKMSEVPLILRYDKKVSTSKMKIFKTVFTLLKLMITE